MKKLLAIYPFLMLAFILTGCSRTTQYSAELTLTNNTDINISEIYVSESEANNWSENKLYKDWMLTPGNSIDTNVIFYDAKNTLWDLKIISDDGSIYYRTGLNFIENRSFSITSDWDDYDEPKITINLTIKNNLGTDIYSMHISRESDADYWSNNLLKDDEILRDGFSIKINHDVYTAGSGLWNIIVLDGEQNDYIWTNIDLENLTSFTLEKN